VEVLRRAWGSCEVLAEGPAHKVTRLTVEPGHRLPDQRHHRRSEHWFVVAGRGLAVVDGTAHSIGPGDALDVPAGTSHRLGCLGTRSLVVIEVQHGTSFDEDDAQDPDDRAGPLS